VLMSHSVQSKAEQTATKLSVDVIVVLLLIVVAYVALQWSATWQFWSTIQSIKIHFYTVAAGFIGHVCL
jgi:hypothetical protein